MTSLKIGIIEIESSGHFTLVNSIARIYCSNLNNEIIIATLTKGIEILYPLLSGFPNISFREFNEADLSNTEIPFVHDEFDRLYFVTLSGNFSLFNKFPFDHRCHVVIHNIELWFHLSIVNNFFDFLRSLKKASLILYHLKKYFIYPYYYRLLRIKFLKSNVRLVVLNPVLKIELAKFYKSENIEVIPFSIYDRNLTASKISNGSRIRFCLPGMVSAFRRDYESIFRILEEDIEYFKQEVEIDLLGGISESEKGWEIIERARTLIKSGVCIHLYEKSLVPVSEFDLELSKAHFVIGNFKVALSKYSIYGKTKDSGALFTCIHAGKPGLFPKEYPIMEELKSSVITFTDYSHLGKILRELINNPSQVKDLTRKAIENSEKFEPSRLLKNLV